MGARLAALAAMGALLGIPLAAEVARADGCPASVALFSSYHTPVKLSPAAVTFDHTFTDVWTVHQSYDRALGKASISAASGGLCSTSLRVVECLDVVGVAAGTPVDGVLQLRVEGQTVQNCGGSGCGVLTEAWLVAGADSIHAEATQYGPTDQTQTVSTTLVRPIHFVAGSPVETHFVLRYGTGPGAGGESGAIDVAWSVANLPAGVRAIASSGADVTPVKPASWGGVKLLYR